MTRPLTAAELADYLAGRVTYPGAVETAHGVLVPASTPRRVTVDTLTYAVEFECPFTVTADGMVADPPAGVWAPDVYWYDGDPDAELEPGYADEWRFYSRGYTGQYGYAGPVLHPSEQLAGGLARDMLEDPGVYVVCAVSDPEDPDALIGWCVLRWRGDE